MASLSNNLHLGQLMNCEVAELKGYASFLEKKYPALSKELMNENKAYEACTEILNKMNSEYPRLEKWYNRITTSMFAVGAVAAIVGIIFLALGILTGGTVPALLLSLGLIGALGVVGRSMGCPENRHKEKLVDLQVSLKDATTSFRKSLKELNTANPAAFTLSTWMVLRYAHKIDIDKGSNRGLWEIYTRGIPRREEPARLPESVTAFSRTGQASQITLNRNASGGLLTITVQRSEQPLQQR